MTLIGGGQSEFLSYKVLHGRALGGLCALASRGIEAPTPLVMMVSPARDFLTAFWAAQLGGMVPVPVSMGQKPEHLRRLTRIMEYFPTAPILAPEGYRPFFASCGLLSRFIAYESLKLSEDAVPVVSPGSTGLIQFSSGSTGAPTGVILSQKNLVSNIVHISKKIEYLGDDSTSLSWMPLSHDMGLIGMHLVPLLLGWSQVLMDPAVFLEEPIRWLEALEQNKVTVTASPNFGLGYTLSRLGEPGFSAYDLSCLRLLINGAEPISPSVCRSFSLELSRAGCPTNPMVPVYGLAQATLAVTFSKPENPLGSLSLDRDALSRGEAVLSRDESALELVSLGKPLENTEVIIVDPEARLVSPLPEEVVGEVRVRGESVAIDQVGGELPVEQGWLCTGDMGFLHHGELYITGRTKDIFIYGGQNYYLNDFERILEEKGGVPPGQVACAVLPPQDGGEECMVVFREKYLRRVAETSGMSMEQAMQAQGQLFSTLLGREAGVPLKKGAIMQSFPKTTSGKLQRFLLTQAVLNNEIPLVIFKEKIKESDWLVALWDETLPPREGGHVTDPDASYFDLGGDSLSLARLLGKITNRVGVRVSFSAFYSRPTLRVLTELVSGAPHRESEGTGVTNDGVLALPGPARRIFIAQSLINLSERYDSLTYNLPQLIGIRGALDVERLSDAFADLFARHPVLSSYVGFEGGEATLMRGPVEPFRLAREEGCAREVGDRFNDFVRPFNIGKGPLIRLRLVSQDEQNHWLFLDIHHCIIDGISLGILLLELLERYMGRVLPQPTADYSAYTRWFHGQKTLASYQSQGEYWRALLTEPMDSLTFPVNPQGWERGVWRSEGLLPLSLMQQFRNMKETTGVSDTALLLSLVALYLYRVTGVEQFLMGLVVSGREAGFTGTVGNLINLVPVVCRPAQTRTVKELALTIHGTLAGALENQQYQYESLMRHRKGGTSLFDVVCIYQNFINLGEPVHVMGESLGNLPFQLSLERFSTGLMGGDLSFEFIPRGDELVIRSEVSREIAPEFSLALIPTFIALCEEAVKKEMPLEQFQFGDIPKSMAPGKVTAAGAQPPSLVERLVHTAKNNIHKPAVITEDQAWTYGELFRRAESSVAELAKYSALIIESGDVIHRLSLMLGSLMARVPFAILDPGLPLARRERLLRIFPGAPVLCEGNAVWSADDWSFFLESSDTSGRPGPGGSGGVLVFTSGTTGEARAVLVSHENIAHYMDAFFQVVALGTSHVIGTSSSFMVDISFEAFFGAFLSGAALF
ncbi:AMP-binding protein, partial [Myxococcota bacterium]|nr:AMP-binding protein [Myxococcota bacterium]